MIERAQILNASEHTPELFQDASAQLRRAKQALTNRRYEQSDQFAQQAQRVADETVTTAGVKEFQRRAKEVLDRIILQAERDVRALQ